ncbi:SpoIIE family protein phosphatase [Streptomyces sp. NPDC052301]|uniref:SpoIIE family protein phosphatase n=1 Tax=Streptomyces sp. NPDC052301 TaxID=3365687 RepID=UPI0037D7D883
MGTAAPPGAPSRRPAPAPQSAALARRFVRSALDDVPPDLEGTAELLVGELVTNAMIHARTEVDLLPAHSTLLLFTDGLIERRGESLDDAMARLRRHTATHAQAPLDVFCDEPVIKFGTDSTDDIALLALRPTPRHDSASRG